MNRKFEQLMEKSSKYITIFIVIKVIFFRNNKMVDMITHFTLYPLATIVSIFAFYYAYKNKNIDEMKKIALYFVILIILALITYFIKYRV